MATDPDSALPGLRPAALAALRAVALAAWLCGGMATVALIYPLVRRARQQRLKQQWSRGLLHVLGIRLDLVGTPAEGGLIVANHVSWVDVFAINALAPAGFVAKSEVRRWPVIGWLCAHTETLFIRRGSARAARSLTRTMHHRLAVGATLAAFPEGTSTRGDAVLPFMPALFEGAVAAGVAVRPLALSYRRWSAPSDAAAYAGDTGLVASIARILRTRGLCVRLDWLPPIAVASQDRRSLALLSEQQIRARLPSVARWPAPAPVDAIADEGVVA